MKKPQRRCRITVTILKPQQEIFHFLLNPENTPKWVPSIVKEETSQWPPQEGTIYRNQTDDGVWHEYVVTSLDPRYRSFIFRAQDGNYHVRYTLTPVSDTETELEYYEWVIRGALPAPFTKTDLKRLKTIIESR